MISSKKVLALERSLNEFREITQEATYLPEIACNAVNALEELSRLIEQGLFDAAEDWVNQRANRIISEARKGLAEWMD